MKKTYSIFILSLLLLTFAACDKEEMFGDMNENPNAAKNIENNPELILTSLCKDPVNTFVNDAWSNGNLMAQYAARIVFTSFDQFSWGSNSGTWNLVYRATKDADNLYKNATASDNPSYAGVALIMKSWMFQILTDMWGDVPYSEANRAKSGITHPKYDTQQEIYQGIINDLDSANIFLSQSNLPAIKGDLIYEGDLEKWRKFGNSLMLRAYIRLSEIDATTAEAGINKIANAPSNYPVFTSNDDNATLSYLSSKPNTHPRAEASGYRVGSFNEYRMSETLGEVLADYNDPRQQQWFDPTAVSVESGSPEWSGMANGLVDGAAYVYKGGDAHLSKFRMDFFYFAPNLVEGLLMQYSEVEFILAEAAMNGWIGNDAKTHYENGVKASFDYWGVSMPSNYLKQSGVAYNDDLKTLMIQKWIALFYIDYQGFCEFKRHRDILSDIIIPGDDALYATYPSRFEYPTDEQALNKESWEAALEQQGWSNDRILNKVWWEN
ncbi:MAG: SusD/RagB family nutrient-binding outer membrane lipoprotein [Bacteroidetes bacterium]|nr:SusD/RagB family nutrient-binding outer membrane lipoprotein [Bacteroidota bacterium]